MSTNSILPQIADNNTRVHTHLATYPCADASGNQQHQKRSVGKTSPNFCSLKQRAKFWATCDSDTDDSLSDADGSVDTGDDGESDRSTDSIVSFASDFCDLSLIHI